MSDQKKHRFGFFHRARKTGPLSVAGNISGASADSAHISGSTNSGPSLRNIQKASKELDEYLRDLDDNDERFIDVLSMSRNIEKVESYVNSSFAGCVLEEEKLTFATRLLVDLAAKSAKAVYNKSTSADLKASAFVHAGETRKIRADELGGLMKATTVTLYKGKEESTGADVQDVRVMVVAIRGTASLHDWLVNFNDTAQLESSFAALDLNGGEAGLVQSDLVGATAINSPYMIHGGFLACAKFMTDPVAQKIKETLIDAPSSKLPILVFTGHSAGGAVASLLYTHLLRSTESTKLTALRGSFATVHCFTFGAPPITSPALAPFNQRSRFLAFVNENDPIPRCDGPYLRSLLRLFATHMPEVETRPWELPEPVLFNAGEVLLIQKGTGGQLVLSKPKKEGAGSLKETVMGNPHAHKMNVYLEKLSGIVGTDLEV